MMRYAIDPCSFETPVPATLWGDAARDDVAPPKPCLMPPRRLCAGPVTAEISSFAEQQTMPLAPNPQIAQLIVPIRGGATVALQNDVHRVAVGAALLLAQRDAVDCVWQAGSTGLVLQIPRTALQILAFQLHAEPRRLTSGALLFDRSSLNAAFEAAIAAFSGQRNPDASAGDAIVAGVVTLLRQRRRTNPLLFPLAASVKRAIDHLRGNVQHATQEHLARAAGVTLAVLRRNVRECAGVTLARLIQDAQLDWARDRLKSTHESRSIGQLAAASGVGAPGVFTRTYQRRFGETPTQTRVRAFAE
jgi:AraC-like DNA-binding protein